MKRIRAVHAVIAKEQEAQDAAFDAMAADGFAYLARADNHEALQRALWDFGIKERPWGYGKTEAEITAEVDRQVQEWEVKNAPWMVCKSEANIEAILTTENAAAEATLAQMRAEAEKRVSEARDPNAIFELAGLWGYPTDVTNAEVDALDAVEAAEMAQPGWTHKVLDEQKRPTLALIEALKDFGFPVTDEALDKEWRRLFTERQTAVAMVAKAEEAGVPIDEYKAEKQANTELERQVERELRRREILRLADEREAGAAAPLVVHSRSEMAALPSPKALWEGWLFSSSPAELSAPGGVGKTTLALGLAVASFHAVPLLGSFTRKGRTLYIAGEGERVLDRRLRAWEIHLEVAEGSTEVDFIYGSPLNAATLRQVSEAVRAGEYQLVIADTFSALAQINSENDNREVSRFLRGFHRAVLDANPEATPLLIHHVTETTDTRGRKSQKSRGASAFRDDHDTVLMLQGSADSFSMSSEQSKAGKQKDAAPRTLDGLALRKVGPHVVVVLQEEAERAKHIEEVRRLVGLMVPRSGYTSTELQQSWGLASNKGRYQVLRTEAIEAGVIVKGEGNKGRYLRVDPVADSVRSSGHVATKQRPNDTTEPEAEHDETGDDS